jgi:hypothetical protein
MDNLEKNNFLTKTGKQIKGTARVSDYDLIKNQVIIQVSKNTKQKLNVIRKGSESYDKFLQTLLEHVESCDRFWEDRF